MGRILQCKDFVNAYVLLLLELHTTLVQHYYITIAAKNIFFLNTFAVILYVLQTTQY
jgi:hypothetical protein